MFTQLLYRNEASTHPQREQNTNELPIKDRSSAKTQDQLRQSECIFRKHFASAAKTMYEVMISPSLSRTCGETLSQWPREHFAQRFDCAAALCDVTIAWWGGIAVSLQKNVRFSCDHDRHATPVINHEQTQHARCRLSDHARHVMHIVERRCGAYGLLFGVPKSSETDKI